MALRSKLGSLTSPWLLLALAALAPATATVASDALAESLPSRGRPWLGIGMDDRDGSVRISHVVHGSPAEAAGLARGDRLVAIDGEKVQTASQVSQRVGRHAIGDSVEVSYLRGGEPARKRVTLGTMPSERAMTRMDTVGLPAKPFAGLTTVRGQVPAGPTALAGKVVLLDFWATWCGPCRMIAPRIAQLSRRYGAEGLTVIGIASAEEVSTVAPYVERERIPYAIAADPDGETSSAYGVRALPTLYLIDKRGVVREVVIGVDGDTLDALEAKVKALLAEP